MEKIVKKPIVFIKSYGCAFNRFCSERLKNSLVDYFFVYNQSFGSDRNFFRNKKEEKIASEAEYLVIFACPITRYLEKMSADFISNIAKSNKNARIIITGCSLSHPETLLKNKQENKNISFLTDKEMQAFFKKNRGTAIKENYFINDAPRIGTLLIKIGCDNYCSYCICPHINKIKNVSLSEIKKEIKNIQKERFESIEFAGSCVGDWINPKNKKFKFADLVEFILLKTDLKIVNLELYPTDFTDNLIRLLANNKISKDISIPIQSGSDRVLRLMGRKYDKAILKKILDNLFRSVSELQLTTDIIIGFPGETKNDLLETLDFLKSFEFYRIDVYRYSNIKKLEKEIFGNSVDYFSEIIKDKKYKEINKAINLTSA